MYLYLFIAGAVAFTSLNLVTEKTPAPWYRRMLAMPACVMLGLMWPLRLGIQMAHDIEDSFEELQEGEGE